MLERTEAPEDLIGVAELKEELGIVHSDHDNMLTRYLGRATQHLDGATGILGRAIVSQKWKITFPKFDRTMTVDFGPLISLDSITYYDPDDVEQNLDLSTYRVHGGKWSFYLKLKPGQSLPATERRDDAVTINFTAGFGTPDDVPEPISGAIVMMAGYFYHHPTAGSVEKTHPVAIGVDDLIAPYRNMK